MKDCFIQTLEANITNQNIPQHNSLRVRFKKMDSDVANEHKFGIAAAPLTTVNVVGNGAISETFPASSLKTIQFESASKDLYASDDDMVVEFYPVSSIKVLNIAFAGSNPQNLYAYSRIIENPVILSTNNTMTDFYMQGSISPFNLDYLQNAPLQYIRCENCTNVTGTTEIISTRTALKDLRIERSQVTGLFNDLFTLTNILNLAISGTPILGTITGIGVLTKLRNLGIAETGVSGSLDDVLPISTLTSIAITNTPNLTKKRSTINTLIGRGVNVVYDPNDPTIIEDV